MERILVNHPFGPFQSWHLLRWNQASQSRTCWNAECKHWSCILRWKPNTNNGFKGMNRCIYIYTYRNLKPQKLVFFPSKHHPKIANCFLPSVIILPPTIIFFWRLLMQYIIWSNRQNITNIRLTHRASASALLFSDIVYYIMDTLHYTSSTPFSLSLYALQTSPKDIEDREASQPVHARWGSWWECQHPHSQSHQSSLPRCWDDRQIARIKSISAEIGREWLISGNVMDLIRTSVTFTRNPLGFDMTSATQMHLVSFWLPVFEHWLRSAWYSQAL